MLHQARKAPLGVARRRDVLTGRQGLQVCSGAERPAGAGDHADPEAVLHHLAEDGVLAGTVAPRTLRLVTSLEVDDAGVDRACRALASAP